MSIQLNNLNKAYAKNAVVRNINLEIETGELFVLLGASGSGKSTILRMIAGLTPLDKGQISLNGRDVTRLPSQKRDTGVVFQNYSLFAHLNVAQNIEFGLKIRHVPRPQRKQRIEELLELVGLAGYEKRMTWQLSGGQQQRVALARAIAPNPSVLLLDEPFGALDVKIRTQLRQNLKLIQQQFNITTILVTHDQEEAFELADRIGIIEGGQLLEVGTPTQLYRRPQNRFTATFLGTANLLPAQRNGRSVYIGQRTIPAPPGTEALEGQPVDILFRPEEVDLALQPEGLNGHLISEGTIQHISFAGSLERATVTLSDASRVHVLLTPDQVRLMNIQPGQAVYVGLKDYHLLPRLQTA